MRYLLILILFALTNSIQAQVHLDGRNTYTVDGNVFILKETGNPLSVNEAWEYFTQKKFKPIATPGNSINLGFVRHFYWLAIPVKNTLLNNQSLEAGIDNGGIFRIEFYLLDINGKLINHYITGTNYDFDSRAIKNRHFYFPLNLMAGSEAIIFYRIDMRGNGFHIPLRIFKKDYILHSESNLAIFYSFFSGWLLFVSFFSLLAYLWIKGRVYLFYCFYVTSFCLFFLGDGNFDVAWLYPHLSFMATISPSIYAMSMCFFMLLFMGDFLSLKTTHKKLFILSRAWALLLVIAMILVPCGYVFSTNMGLRTFIFNYCLIAAAGAWVIQVYSIICRIRDKYKPAYLYGFALLGVFLAALMYVLHVVNVLPDLLPTFFYLPLGFAIEIILLSIALVYSYTFLKNQSQQLSLTVANQKLDFSRQLLEVQELEQKRIAEDLHDELGGNLAAIKMNLQIIGLDNEKSARMIELIDKASDNARHIAHNLMPPEFEGTRLEELLQNFYNKLNREGSIHFDFLVSGKDGHFDKQKSLIIYRILLELTTNIIKHAAATTATIQLINYDQQLEIVAEDNGTGFTNTELSDGIGLKNIRSRVNFLQGKLNIDSGASGTTIMITIPYN